MREAAYLGDSESMSESIISTRLHSIDRIVIGGSRDWTDVYAIDQMLVWLQPDRVAHGDCRGADTIGKELAIGCFLEVIGYPADWERYGNAAGPIRNRHMLDSEKPNLVVAFLLPQSRGTRNLLDEARKRGIPTLTYEPNSKSEDA